MALSPSRAADLDDLVLALARWLDAAQALPGDLESRLTAIEDARGRLAACTGSLPLGMAPSARRGWTRAWTEA